MGLSEHFTNPPSEYRQAPFWFWNHRLDKDTLTWQMELMKEKGIGGFVMHPRMGLMTPYLSDDWFEYIRFCTEAARAMGMIPWAYDEQDWPSGIAGGTVIQDHANRLNFLRLETEEVQGPCSVALSDDVVCAYAGPVSGPMLRARGRECAIGDGTWRVTKAVRFQSPPFLWGESYLDTINPDACLAFQRSTYDLHEERLGNLKELGLEGFFTDEPCYIIAPDDRSRITWTPQLPQVFLERKGYDLLDHLPELFSQDEAGAQIRYDFWDIVSSLFSEAYFKTLYDWCDERGLQFIGHIPGEEPLFYQFRTVGDIFRCLKYCHIPGMDHLGIHIGKENVPASMIPKVLSSIALLNGRERVFTETFGNSDWHLTLRDMKWMADWQIVHGINYIMPHAFYYSVAGRRKKDAPPSEFVQAPYWPHYRTFADYTARLTAALTGGEHGAKIAMFYPMSSMWADFIPEQELSPATQELEDAFAPLGNALLRIHRDFVIIDEPTFATAQVKDGQIAINDLTFSAVVVPKLTSIREEALEALRHIAQACPIILTSSTPVRVLRAAGPAVGDKIDLAAELGAIVAAPTDESLAAALSDIVPEVALDNAPDVYYLHRRKDGKALYFFANTAQAPVQTTISLETMGRAEIWNPETGAATLAAGQRLKEGRLSIPLNLAAVGSCLIAVDPAEPVADEPVIELQPSRRIKLCDTPLWHFSPENGNFLTLKQWDFRLNTQLGLTELQYRTGFMMPERLGNLRLILDGVPKDGFADRGLQPRNTSSVTIDGNEVTAELPWEIDPQFRVIDLRGKCDPGTHTIGITIKNIGYAPQPGLEEYAWLAGDFQIDRSVNGMPCLIPIRGIQIGSWEDHGYPHFSGTGCYYTNIEIPEEAAGKRIWLDAGRVGSLLEVEINAQPVGVRAWPPYKLEVTGHVRPGQNQFMLKVTNSGANFFQGPDKANPSGLLDDVYLEFE